MKYYLIAGEASGDLHGSNLMKGLYAKDPGADIRYWGGPLMDAVCRDRQGQSNMVSNYAEGAVMGFWEVIRSGGKLLGRLRRCKEDILSWKPDAVVLIDYPGFNFRIAEFAHKAGFKVFYYIAPKVWASREGRIRKLKKYVDRLFIIFPFEKDYFSRKGVDYVYEGNPLVDAIDSSPAMNESREAFLSRTSLPDRPMIALLAGSRKMEIKTMMPVLSAFADRMHALEPYKDHIFVLAGAPARSEEDYSAYLEGRPWLRLVFGETYAVLRNADAAVVNSGTASLEAALIGTPQVVGYRMAALTYAVARMIVKVRYISLANLILDKLIFRELIQDQCSPDNILTEIRRLLEDSPYRGAMLRDYATLREVLGGGGASEKVAEKVVETMQGFRQ